MELTVFVFVLSLLVVGVLLITTLRRDFAARNRRRDAARRHPARAHAPRYVPARAPERGAGRDSFTA